MKLEWEIRHNMYDGEVTSRNYLIYLMTSVHKCMSENSASWSMRELSTNCQVLVISAHHVPTELSCNIFFDNGLSVETTNLIKTINDAFPPCRKIILFLKQWLAHCNLSGPEGISNYAICWLVIFYLQKESELPSIATLIAASKTRVIAGWKIGVVRDFARNEMAASNFTIDEFLIRFFTFYANFDFRYDVACPLIGETMKKRLFPDPKKLPEAMSSYVDRMKNSHDPKPLRVDSPMCIQDPFDLGDNLTKAVTKVCLRRFRNYCSKSVEVLCVSS